MQERSILFSAPMVLAINREKAPKTQTRREVKGAVQVRLLREVRSDVPGFSGACANPGVYTAHLNPHGAVSVQAADGQWLGVKPDEFEWVCPFGQIGDQLWVRETWRTAWGYDDCPPRDVPQHAPLKYEADEAIANPEALEEFGGEWGKTRVSIFMPRWASRTTLVITRIRLQRLNAITEADAAAEGLIRLPATGRYVISQGDQYFGLADPSAVRVFARLWDGINGEGNFERNPFVWVLDFRKVPQ